LIIEKGKYCNQFITFQADRLGSAVAKQSVEITPLKATLALSENKYKSLKAKLALSENKFKGLKEEHNSFASRLSALISDSMKKATNIEQVGKNIFDN
jgi:hypothetical protein